MSYNQSIANNAIKSINRLALELDKRESELDDSLEHSHILEERLSKATKKLDAIELFVQKQTESGNNFSSHHVYTICKGINDILDKETESK